MTNLNKNAIKNDMNPGSVIVKCCHQEAGCSLGIGDRRILCLLHDSPANVQWPMTILYSDMEPLSKYSPVTLHLLLLVEFLKTTLMKVPYSFPRKGDQEQSSASSHKQAWQGRD